MNKLKAKLDESRLALEKTLKLAETCRDKYLPMASAQGDGSRLLRALEELQTTCEAADNTFSGATRVWKYGKDEQGKPVATDGFVSTTKKVEDDKELILADIKTVRVHVPEIVKESD